jgi:iron complex transport system substrate-binding protein
VYGLLGLVNVADAADPDGAAFGYPQLSTEFLLASDPDLVFLADSRCCDQDATTFAARPGFSDLRAVVDGGVIVLDDDVASRWGPRIVNLLEQIAAAVRQVAAR